jgi:putative transposase
LNLREGKKIEIIRAAVNKKLAGVTLGVDARNIYQKTKQETKDLSVKEEIEKVFEDNPAYGARRLAIELKYNHKRMSRVMRKYGLKPPRLWYTRKYLTEANLKYKDQFSNLIKNVSNPKINEIWSSDLTYVNHDGKFIYVCAIKDICTKEIVALGISRKHDSNLVLTTIKEGILKQKTKPFIFHYDRGREFLNEKCINFLKANGIKISVSDPGSPWQNGHIESFWSRFKCENGDLRRFEDLGELVEYIYQWVNYYNNERIVTKLKMSPVKFKQKLLNQDSYRI